VTVPVDEDDAPAAGSLPFRQPGVGPKGYEAPGADLLHDFPIGYKTREPDEDRWRQSLLDHVLLGLQYLPFDIDVFPEKEPFSQIPRTRAEFPRVRIGMIHPGDVELTGRFQGTEPIQIPLVGVKPGAADGDGDWNGTRVTGKSGDKIGKNRPGQRTL